MALTFWEKMYLGNQRDALRSRWHTSDAVRQVLSAHNVSPSCALIAAEQDPAIGTDAAILSEMASLQSYANERRGKARTTQMAWGMGLGLVAMIASTAPKEIRNIIAKYEHGQSWLLHILGYMLVITVVSLFLYASIKTMAAQADLWKRLCRDMAQRLNGKAGLDNVDEIVHWLRAHWRWLLPPDLGKNDVIWAVGERRGAAVMIVIEHALSKFIAERVVTKAAGSRSSAAIDRWTRTNVFIEGARFRDIAHRERVQSRLQRILGGVVQCPHGVYLYGAYAFLGAFCEDGPNAEIWVDLVDQVLDPQFQGSPSAMRNLLEEMRLLKLLPAGKVGAPHA